MPSVFKFALYRALEAGFGGAVAYLTLNTASVPQADQLYVAGLITVAPMITGAIGHLLPQPGTVGGSIGFGTGTVIKTT